MLNLRFHEDRILREQVDLVYKNYPPGVGGYAIVCITTLMILQIESSSTSLSWWLSICLLVCVAALARQLWLRNKQLKDVRLEASIQVVTLLLLGFLWAYIPLFYLEGADTEASIWIISLTTGLCAASLTMQSPSLPAFLAFFVPCILSLMVASFAIGTEVFVTIGFCAIVYLTVLTWMGVNLEATVRKSIELRHTNDDLIDQLRTALDETKEANKSKSVFLASASHDLRQPTHAMGLFVETLMDTPLSAHQGVIVENLHLAVNSTRNMLNTLLDFSKLDAGAIQPNPKPFLVQSMFTKLENDLAPEADKKGLIYRSRETNQAAYADAQLVELILRNLVANAIRYTQSGGLVVGCRRLSGGDLSLEVWDSGIGIAKEFQEDIFKEFYQLGNPERDREKGFGLGLANAKGLAESMGLEVSLNSCVDRGSVFKLQLPRSTAAVIEDITPELLDNRILEGKRILFIDDDKPIRLAMQSLFDSWGCLCMPYESTEQALAEQGDQVFDLLIVDYRLQNNVTGKEVIEQLRRHYSSDLPAIIVTGDTASDRIVEARSVDALLLHKPTSSAQLRNMVSILLK